MAHLVPFDGVHPEIDPTAFVAPTATLIGDVRVGARTGVFYGAVVRGDLAPIRVGAGTNLQDNVVVHADPDFPATIGDGVTVGHGAVVHGCTVADGCLIGMSATVMNGAVIGAGSLVAAGALVLEGTQVPPHSLVAGVPAKVRRELTDDEIAGLAESASRYVEISRRHRGAGSAS
ncbi:gamma carbonic anhydrase family protein [Occultella gossypii]|uniref:Gamma carbonic anhydrase family protein n=1 Tax=Occultella gossypii TaxID=2800820 RepID=A0ABS7SG35_9MICO|nr:gamma carbonic anhydrase family protein [Occultella gossypii]MBZ2199306.1 gamma carbonic anhydrase family protein [Occultella gossypii]